MPFRSESQRRFLWANHPDIAKRWAQEYGSKPMKEKEGKAEPGDSPAEDRAEKHPGFKAVAAKIAAKYGGNMKKASAILASGSMHASKAAKEKNPRLNKVGAAQRKMKKK